MSNPLGNVLVNAPTESMRKVQYARTPHKCPVCEGRGMVPSTFYQSTAADGTGATSSLGTETCRTCGGTGIVWEPK